MINKLIILFQALRTIQPRDWLTFFNLYSQTTNQPKLIHTNTGLKFNLRANQIDYWLFLENIVLDTYSLKDLQSHKYATIIDIGANIGLFSTQAYQLWPQAKLISVEPNPESYKLLTQNLQLNQIQSQTYQSAVTKSANPKQIKLYYNQNPAMVSQITGSGKSFTANTITLEQLTKNIQTPALLKIDIEGGEYDLFTDKQLPYLKKFHTIVMEYHDLNSKQNLKFITKFLKLHSLPYFIDDLIIRITP